MIAFDLECASGHVFEGWFDSLKSFEEQKKKKLISCPYCDDTNTKKVLSPVAVKRSASDPQPASLPIDYNKLAKEVVNYINNNSEDVGAKFAAEALKMHYGVSEKRNIRGTASPEEENTLREEGVEFFRFPVPKVDTRKKN